MNPPRPEGFAGTAKSIEGTATAKKEFSGCQKGTQTDHQKVGGNIDTIDSQFYKGLPYKEQGRGRWRKQELPHLASLDSTSLTLHRDYILTDVTDIKNSSMRPVYRPSTAHNDELGTGEQGISIPVVTSISLENNVKAGTISSIGGQQQADISPMIWDEVEARGRRHQGDKPECAVKQLLPSSPKHSNQENQSRHQFVQASFEQPPPLPPRYWKQEGRLDIFRHQSMQFDDEQPPPLPRRGLRQEDRFQSGSDNPQLLPPNLLGDHELLSNSLHDLDRVKLPVERQLPVPPSLRIRRTHEEVRRDQRRNRFYIAEPQEKDRKSRISRLASSIKTKIKSFKGASWLHSGTDKDLNPLLPAVEGNKDSASNSISAAASACDTGYKSRAVASCCEHATLGSYEESGGIPKVARIRKRLGLVRKSTLQPLVDTKLRKLVDPTQSPVSMRKKAKPPSPQ